MQADIEKLSKLKKRPSRKAGDRGGTQPLKTRSQNMKNRMKAWESRSNNTKKKEKRNRRFHGKRTERHKTSPNKYKLLKKHLKKMHANRHFDDLYEQPCRNNIRMHTKYQQEQIDRTHEADANDPLLKSFNIAGRKSPIARCSKWVESLPHSSVWDKEVTLSGNDLTNSEPNRNIPVTARAGRSHNYHTHHRLKRGRSERSRLMKKIMAKKMRDDYLLNGDCRVWPSGTMNPKSSTERQKHRHAEREQIADNDYDTEISDGEFAQDTSAKNVSLLGAPIPKRKRRKRLRITQTREDAESVEDNSSCENKTLESLISKKRGRRMAREVARLSKKRMKTKRTKRKHAEREMSGSDFSEGQRADRNGGRGRGRISDDTVTLKKKAHAIAKRVVTEEWPETQRKKKRRAKSMMQVSKRASSRGKVKPTRCKSEKVRRHRHAKAIHPSSKPKRKCARQVVAARQNAWRSAKKKKKSNYEKECQQREYIEKRLRKGKAEGALKRQMAREKKRTSLMERTQDKMRKWFHQKTRVRPRCRNSTNLYARKHRPGLFLTRNRNTKSSLGWSILQSIKFLEGKGISYPIAILKILRKQWGHNDLTLAELNQCLNWMMKRGIVKSDTVREGERRYCTVPKCKKTRKTRLPQRASFLCNKKEFAIDESDSSEEYGIPVGRRKRSMRVRFRHKPKDLTSVKLKKYGSYGAGILSDEWS